MEKEKATLIVSLDFELYWGVRDLYDLNHCRAKLLNVRPAILRLLDLFWKFEIHATWATVGFLLFRNRRELLAALPCAQPNYSSIVLSPYRYILCIGHDEEDDPFHFAPSMVQAILDTPHQELGTHTFSHYYCLEDGQTEASFRDDLQAAGEAAKSWNVELRSLVFPRNQVNTQYLRACADCGILAYRGAGQHWMYRERKRSSETAGRRAMRLLDAYVNISGHHTFRLGDTREDFLCNVPASRYLRPYWPRLRMLEPLRIERICRGLNAAAAKREAYHLWFHPEDFGLNLDENLACLEQILRRFARLRSAGRMESLNMGEAANRVAARSHAGSKHDQAIYAESQC
ncbi:MAG: polysaccharide deacetylase family protein [Acidobacteriaceae bacterium]|nr:polysaccharide deacetylase family protein [Acidobacteriaceae bacterium]